MFNNHKIHSVPKCISHTLLKINVNIQKSLKIQTQTMNWFTFSTFVLYDVRIRIRRPMSCWFALNIPLCNTLNKLVGQNDPFIFWTRFGRNFPQISWFWAP